MYPSVLFFHCCAIALINAASSSAPVARTQYGDVEGFRHETKKGHSVDVFLGIPFASPPVGDLRFRQPEPPPKWSGVKKTVEFPRACAQEASSFAMPPAGQGEDCLYLNVFAPAKKKQHGTSYPVMVWIYGGAFKLGSAFDYGKEGICENFVARDVVVVVIQYRLSIYGFLSTGDNSAPGNWGLWDQVEALGWVKQNIENFGGDPNRVTIFGESAGGGCVSFMTLIPAARDLFQQSIAQSGSALAFWATQQTPRKIADDFAATAGCVFADTEKLVQCLRSKTSEELDQALKSSVVAKGIVFVPTVDGILIPDVPEKLAETQLPKPAILGTCHDENLVGVRPSPRMAKFGGLFVGDDHLTIEKFLGMINMTFSEALFPNSVDVARKLARFHYVDSRPRGDVDEETFLLWRLIELMSDAWMHVPTFNDAVSKAKVGAPVYLYDFNFFNPKFFPDDFEFKGTAHGMDIVYEFGVEGTMGSVLVDKTVLDENDQKMTDLFCTLLTNFAKYGNPTPELLDGVVWPSGQPSLDCKALRIALPPSVGSFHRPTMAFWTDLLRFDPHSCGGCNWKSVGMGGRFILIVVCMIVLKQ